jgi:hypothetical protein
MCVFCHPVTGPVVELATDIVSLFNPMKSGSPNRKSVPISLVDITQSLHVPEITRPRCRQEFCPTSARRKICPRAPIVIIPYNLYKMCSNFKNVSVNLDFLQRGGGAPKSASKGLVVTVADSTGLVVTSESDQNDLEWNSSVGKNDHKLDCAEEKK